MAPGSRFDRETSRGEDRYYHLVLLAENNTGYSNLMKIVSAGFIDGFYYKPRVDMEILEKYHEGIIALSACLAGEIPRALSVGDYDEAKAAADRVIGDVREDGLAALIEELWFDGPKAEPSDRSFGSAWETMER